MNTALIPSRIEWNFHDRDVHAARARLSALDEALRRRDVATYFGECDLNPGHAVVLQAGRGTDSIVIISLRTENGSYLAIGRGNPPLWLAAHVESAWIEVS